MHSVSAEMSDANAHSTRQRLMMRPPWNGELGVKPSVHTFLRDAAPPWVFALVKGEVFNLQAISPCSDIWTVVILLGRFGGCRIFWFSVHWFWKFGVFWTFRRISDNEPNFVRLYRRLWENDSTSLLIYSLSLCFNLSSFKSSSIQHDVHLVNMGPFRAR